MQCLAIPSRVVSVYTSRSVSSNVGRGAPHVRGYISNLLRMPPQSALDTAAACVSRLRSEWLASPVSVRRPEHCTLSG